jgi:hypothetical protein
VLADEQAISATSRSSDGKLADFPITEESLDLRRKP